MEASDILIDALLGTDYQDRMWMYWANWNQLKEALQEEHITEVLKERLANWEEANLSLPHSRNKRKGTRIHKEEILPRRVSMGKSTLKEFGGELNNQYDSKKWDAPWTRGYGQRSWKNYRKTQHKAV